LSIKKQPLGLSGYVAACLLVLSSHSVFAASADENSLANRLKEFNSSSAVSTKTAIKEASKDNVASKAQRVSKPKAKVAKRRRFKRACYKSSAATLRDRADSFQPAIRNSSQRYGVSEALIISVITAESCFHHRARSHMNARGLMQLIPATAKRFGVKNSYVPAQNIRGGTRYLKFLLGKFSGNLHLAVAAYNAGEGAVDRYSGIPPYKETKEYVRRVMMVYRRLQAAGSSTVLVNRSSKASTIKVSAANNRRSGDNAAALKAAKRNPNRGHFIKPDYKWKRKPGRARVTNLYKVANNKSRVACRDVSSQKLKRASRLVKRGKSMKRYHSPQRPRSLSSIARTTGVSLNMLLRMNRGASRYMIQPGTKVLVWQCAGR